MATFSGNELQSALLAPEAPHEIGQRTGDEKILLHEPQSLSLAGGVVGIENAGERFGIERLGQRADEIAAAEFLKVEIIVRRRGPEPERIDGLAAVAHDRAIEWNADQTGRPAEDRAQVPPRISNEQLSFTSTVSSGRATSHGSGRRSQLSGCSCCQPSWMDCLKMPYSYRRP